MIYIYIHSVTSFDSLLFTTLRPISKHRLRTPRFNGMLRHRVAGGGDELQDAELLRSCSQLQLRLLRGDPAFQDQGGDAAPC